MASLCVRCRTCSGCARCCVEPKLINRCRLEKKDTKEHGQMLKITLKLAKVEILDRNAQHKGGVQVVEGKIEDEGFMA